MENIRSCIDCPVQSCRRRSDAPQFPVFCPTPEFDAGNSRALAELDEAGDELRLFDAACRSAHISFGNRLSRVDETINFARLAGAQRIGIAACVSLAAEARVAAAIIRKAGFDVFGAICKSGMLSCEDLELDQDGKGEILCNPFYQADLLNAAKTDLNVIIGLCAGHDSVFIKHSDAPVTVLVVKDFAYGHCPVRALRVDA